MVNRLVVLKLWCRKFIMKVVEVFGGKLSQFEISGLLVLMISGRVLILLSMNMMKVLSRKSGMILIRYYLSWLLVFFSMLLRIGKCIGGSLVISGMCWLGISLEVRKLVSSRIVSMVSIQISMVLKEMLFSMLSMMFSCVEYGMVRVSRKMVISCLCGLCRMCVVSVVIVMQLRLSIIGSMVWLLRLISVNSWLVIIVRCGRQLEFLSILKVRKKVVMMGRMSVRVQVMFIVYRLYWLVSNFVIQGMLIVVLMKLVKVGFRMFLNRFFLSSLISVVVLKMLMN